MNQTIFPLWINRLKPVLGLFLGIAPIYIVGVVYLGGNPKTTDVGYMPVQPVPYSHALHAGQLGMDCRYCHNTVESAAHAAIPPTSTCMSCHAKVHTGSNKLALIRESWATGEAVEWIKVHDLPDFVYFNHSAHVNRGVGCVSCHGPVQSMVEVYQHETLSMAWCLDCHRNPEPHLRPPDQVTNMSYGAEDGEGARLKNQLNIQPSQQCSTCHR